MSDTPDRQGAPFTDGQVMWGKWTFCEITAPERLVVVVNFYDAQQGVTRHPMAPSSPTWRDCRRRPESALRRCPLSPTGRGPCGIVR